MAERFVSPLGHSVSVHGSQLGRKNGRGTPMEGVAFMLGSALMHSSTRLESPELEASTTELRMHHTRRMHAILMEMESLTFCLRSTCDVLWIEGEVFYFMRASS